MTLLVVLKEKKPSWSGSAVYDEAFEKTGKDCCQDILSPVREERTRGRVISTHVVNVRAVTDSSKLVLLEKRGGGAVLSYDKKIRSRLHDEKKKEK